MLTEDAQTILSLLKTEGAMDGSDIETQTRLGELEIKKAAIELRKAGLIKTSGASDVHEDDGMAIDRLTITASGQRAR